MFRYDGSDPRLVCKGVTSTVAQFTADRGGKAGAAVYIRWAFSLGLLFKSDGSGQVLFCSQPRSCHSHLSALQSSKIFKKRGIECKYSASSFVAGERDITTVEDSDYREGRATI
ncbi:hypothetical protein O6H91_07G086100 [Diphasiastrum complanatum]|uniref:Uncharacterized protein n=1 Tax=Diphasiastrum complanatum TaxID=34168 RepID=A0ACC2D7D3_DIPCM|nr:hypothetical protein O6H91_07G086100 [Diphasiastrum complanatum]